MTNPLDAFNEQNTEERQYEQILNTSGHTLVLSILTSPLINTDQENSTIL